MALGFAYFSPDESSAGRLLGSGEPAFINSANLMGLPLMAALTGSLGLGHLALAWAMLDRNWARVATICRIGAAITATMVTFTSMLFIYDTCALPQTAAIAIELAAVWALIRWHSDLSAAAPSGSTLSPPTHWEA